MSQATEIADAREKVEAARTKVNGIAAKLLAELVPYAKKKVEDVLSGDTDRVVSLSLDLPIARSELAAAVQDYEALKRRAQ